MSFVSRIIRLNSVKTLSSRSFCNVASSRPASGFKMSNLMASAGPKRLFQTSSRMLVSDNREEVKVTFIRTSGERLEAKGKIGDNLVIQIVNFSPSRRPNKGAFAPCFLIGDVSKVLDDLLMDSKLNLGSLPPGKKPKTTPSRKIPIIYVYNESILSSENALRASNPFLGSAKCR